MLVGGMGDTWIPQAMKYVLVGGELFFLVESSLVTVLRTPEMMVEMFLQNWAPQLIAIGII